MLFLPFQKNLSFFRETCHFSSSVQGSATIVQYLVHKLLWGECYLREVALSPALYVLQATIAPISDQRPP